MNLFSFMKNKDEKNKPEKKSTKLVRLDTESGPILDKKSKQKTRINKEQQRQNEKTEKIQRHATNIDYNQESVSTVQRQKKNTLKIQQLLQTLWSIKNAVQQDYESMQSGKYISSHQIQLLLATNYFRFRKTTYATALDEYLNIIQALQLLISKLSNNEKVPSTIFIKHEEDFVLFFKVFFSKPYHLINRPSVRKIIKLVWDKILFSSLDLQGMVNNIKLWIFGIATPLNPSMNRLHQYVTEHFEEVSRLVTHKSNQNVYIGVNDSDMLGLTPLMAATIAKNTKAMEKLVKNGAVATICPLTVSCKTVKSSIEQSKYGGKVMFKKQYGIKQRKQPDVYEMLRSEKRIDELGQLICWQNYYKKKTFRKNQELHESLLLFPNCSFQIDWKQYKGILCFKELPQDIISIYKKQYCLRVDFHYIGDESIKKGHYSLILKCQPKKQNELYFISHNNKFIFNLLEDKDIQCIKQRYNNILKYGNIYTPQINQINAIYIPQENRITATVESYYQNIVKYSQPSFSSLKQYMNQAISSDLINYAKLEKNQFKSVLSQDLFVGSKIKDKIVTSASSIDIQWANESLNFSHLQLVLTIAQLAFPSSLLVNRLKIISQAMEDTLFATHQFKKKLPLRVKYSFERELSMQSEIKNIRYSLLDDSVFKIQARAKQMNYKEAQEQVDISHLQDTVYLDEMYSINVSRFVGRSEQMLEFQENEANKRFQELLKLEGIWSNDEEEQK